MWLCFQPSGQCSRWGSLAAGQPHFTDCLTSDTAAQSHQLLAFAYQAFKLPHKNPTPADSPIPRADTVRLHRGWEPQGLTLGLLPDQGPPSLKKEKTLKLPFVPTNKLLLHLSANALYQERLLFTAKEIQVEFIHLLPAAELPAALHTFTPSTPGARQGPEGCSSSKRLEFTCMTQVCSIRKHHHSTGTSWSLLTDIL